MNLAVGEAAWVEDIVGDPDFALDDAAARAGLHGACAFPIVHRGRTLLCVTSCTTRRLVTHETAMARGKG